jgi:hypothetical protein
VVVSVAVAVVAFQHLQVDICYLFLLRILFLGAASLILKIYLTYHDEYIVLWRIFLIRVWFSFQIHALNIAQKLFTYFPNSGGGCSGGPPGGKVVLEEKKRVVFKTRI